MSLITQGGDERVESTGSCNVVILYGHPRARSLAIELHDRLQARFWPELDFHFSWWSLRFLDDPGIAGMAGQAVLSADVILFALRPGEALNSAARHWIETWFGQRQNQSGALAVLGEPSVESGGAPGERDSFLWTVAQNAGLDYLTLAESKSERPVMTGVLSSVSALDEALRRSVSSHWGLNE